MTPYQHDAQQVKMKPTPITTNPQKDAFYERAEKEIEMSNQPKTAEEWCNDLYGTRLAKRYKKRVLLIIQQIMDSSHNTAIEEVAKLCAKHNSNRESRICNDTILTLKRKA